MNRTVPLFLVGIAASWVLATPAAAQLDAARRYLGDADFQRAERAFGRALGADELTSDELTAIFEGRAIARWALGDEEDARDDLVALASLDADHVLPAEAPPLLVEAFASLPRTPLTLRLSGDLDADDTMTVHATLEHDPGALVRTIRMHLRRRGELAWNTSAEPETVVRMRDGDVVEAWAEALGPGGAVVAREGTALAPIELGNDAIGVRDALAPPLTPEADTTPYWIGGGIAVVAVAILIGVAVGVATASSDLTQPAPPMVIGF